ncbi:MAG TPA: hypothetical protein VNY05_23370 [Candidatus Acidoferrales bacterium]|jgi:hypothetical protein|nr:hypothetical protein [Candidatus Acidoferrales bacterium]
MDMLSLQARRPLVFFACYALGLLAVARFAGLAVRSTYRYQIIFNEGWNAYHASSASAGTPLYIARPEHTAVTYPPLSFHLVGALSRLTGLNLTGDVNQTGDVNMIGRWLSLLSLVWVVVCSAGVARIISGARLTGLLAGLLCAAWFVLFAPAYVGANDPQMLGHALLMTGVLLYVARRDSTLGLVGSCLLCCLGGFVKQSLLAFPLAIGLDLLWQSPRRFAAWAATAIAILATFAALTVWVDGPYFTQHWFSPRNYSLQRARSVTGVFGLLFLPALAACALWCRKGIGRPSSSVIALGFLTALATGLLLAGGSGVNLNVFFDTVIAMSIITALVLSDLAERSALVAALAPVLLSAGLLVAGRSSSVPPRPALAETSRVFLDDVGYLKSKPGAAICLNLLLCHDAGKPLIYDPYTTSELMNTGRLDPNWMVSELELQAFSVVQLGDDPGSGSTFPLNLLPALYAAYQVDRTGPTRVFYVPRK